MASTTVNVHVERQGLLISVWLARPSGERENLLGTIDLKEEFGLSDDNAQWLLKKLDEQRAPDADSQQAKEAHA